MMLPGYASAQSLEPRQVLAGLLDWTPEIQQAMRDGVLSADDELLGTDLLCLSVMLGNEEAYDLLLRGMPTGATQSKLDEMMELAAQTGRIDLCIRLAARGARLSSGLLDSMAEPGFVDDDQFSALLPYLPGPSTGSDWMQVLVKFLPRMNQQQLTEFLARGSHWSYEKNSNAGLLAPCLANSKSLEQLQRAGLDLPRYLASFDAPVLQQICSAYRQQQDLLETRMRNADDQGENQAPRQLAGAATRLLALVPAVRTGHTGLDARQPELEGLSVEEYVLSTAVADPDFYKALSRLGLNLNATDSDGNSALGLLTMQGQLSDQELLALSVLGMDPLLENYLGYNALHYAILNRRDALALQWLSKARSPQMQAEVALGRIPEFQTAARGPGVTKEAAMRELEKGMLLAARSGRRDTLEAVIAAGYAPLMQALVMLDMGPELGKAFFDQKLLINENITIDSSLTVAVRHLDMDMLQFLFSILPKDQRWIEEAQDQALLAAAACEDRRFLEALLDYGVPVEPSRAGGLTALVAACAEGNLDNVLFLIQKGADPGHGLDYFARQLQHGNDLHGVADAEALAPSERIIRVLLSAVNEQRDGTALGWTGRTDSHGDSADSPALLSTLVSLPDISPDIIHELAGLSSQQAWLAALESCIIRDHGNHLRALLESSVFELDNEGQRKLTLLGLQGGHSDCLRVLLDANYELPAAGKTDRLLAKEAVFGWSK